MTVLRMDTDQVNDLIGGLDRVIAELTHEIVSARRHIQELEAVWVSASRIEYANLLGICLGDVGRLVDILGKLQERLLRERLEWEGAASLGSGSVGPFGQLQDEAAALSALSTFRDIASIEDELRSRSPQASEADIASQLTAVLLHNVNGFDRDGYEFFVQERETTSPALIAKLDAASSGGIVDIYGKRVNLGHVMAGLAARLRQGVAESEFGKMINGLVGTDAYGAMTHIGDLGAVVSAVHQPTPRTLGEAFKAGMLDKFDLEGDVDSFAIDDMMKKEGISSVSDALQRYYGESNPYFTNRYLAYRQYIMRDMTRPQVEAQMTDQVERFAVLLQLRPLVDSQVAPVSNASTLGNVMRNLGQFRQDSETVVKRFLDELDRRAQLPPGGR